jgi:UDP-2,3-diacylglucosamine pyrophosphatase LpxH
MPDIRYVCLSDMHLGAQNSLLTNLTSDSSDTDPAVPSPVLIHLVECLRQLINQNVDKTEKPVLILNGDILELALTTDNEAAMVFERFIELVFPAVGDRLFKNIKYIPGNHDHHLWETAREVQYVQYIQNSPGQKPGSILDVPWHTTKMFEPDPVPSPFLNGIVNRYPHLRNEKIDTIYPNYALLKDNGRSVIFSHGHFVESMYMLMSTLRGLIFPQAQPSVLTGDIEAENFAWIDFFWSTMGRSGAVGADVELVYDKLRSKKAFDEMVDNLADGLAARFKFFRFGGDWIETKALNKLLNFLLLNLTHLERQQPETLMSDDAQAGLKNYLEGPVRKQIETERMNNIPRDMTFIFGHTHKPYQAVGNFEGYHPNLKIFNTGGWVVDTLQPQPLHGAAVILLDENLRAASLRMYNEAATVSDYQVNVKTATDAQDEPNPFYERISQLVDPSRDPWKTFSEIVFSAVPMRFQNLKYHIDRRG